MKLEEKKMSKTTKELISAAKDSADWMRKATPPGELNRPLRVLESAIKKAEQQREEEKASGYLLLIELGDGRKRITVTVETPERYPSRAGWAQLDFDFDITYSAEVPDLDHARETLRTVLQEEQWRGQGMTWTAELSRGDLKTAIDKVATICNGVPRQKELSLNR
jgi:hypothetical protein